jgi:YD repeat-containing protein
MKNKNILLILSILVLLFSNKLNGQEPAPASLLPVTQASPNATELGKYGAMPVSYYTGTPNISIPIYEYKCGGYTLPITLSYHASGIKVNDIATWVGLGWNLSAGGGITVGPKGKFDFSRDRVRIRSKEDLMNLDLFTNSELSSLRNRNIDSEPDVYNYNFCGYSGQFVMEMDLGNDEFVVHFLKNNEGLKMECQRTYYPNPCGDGDCGHWEAKFIATDKNGVKYHFDVFEITDRNDYKQGYDVYANTMYPEYWSNGGNADVGEIEATNWMLTKIELANGIDYIEFQYHTEEYKYQTAHTGTLQACQNDNCLMPGNLIYNWQSSNNTFSFSEIENTVQILDLITYSRDGSKIVFKSEHARQDLLGCNALSEIEVWRNATERILVWDFDYSQYFISNFSIGDDTYGNPLDKRLKLNMLTQYSGDKTKSFPPYIFKYFGDEENDLNLPPRNSFDGFDHWGFLNNNISIEDAQNPGKLFPKIENETSDNMSFICIHEAYQAYVNQTGEKNIITDFWWGFPTIPNFLNGGDRTPDDYYAKSNTLKEISYPTGGKTTFDFQVNRYSKIHSQNNSYFDNEPCGGLRVSEIKDIYDGSNIITRTFSYDGGILFGEPLYIRPEFQKSVMDGNLISSFMHCGGYDAGKEPKVGGYNLYSYSVESLYSPGTDAIGYATVTENNNNGSILYQYYSGYDYESSYNYYYAFRQSNIINVNDFYSEIEDVGDHIYPFSIDNLTGEFSGNAYKRGSIKNIYYKNSANDLVKEENYIYDAVEGEKIAGNRVITIDDDFNFMDAYEISTGKNFLTTKTVTEYDIENSTSIERIYTYTHNEEYEQLKTEETTNSNGDEQISTYIYPHDITLYVNHTDFDEETSGLSHLQNYHIIANPIEQTVAINGEFVKSSILSYQTIIPNDEDSYAVPYLEYSIESNVPFTKQDIEIVPNSGTGVYEFIVDPQYKIKGEYTCDEYGNIISYQKTHDNIISFYYGYNNSLPVIEVKNASYSVLSSAVNSITNDFDGLLENIGDLSLESQKNEWKVFNEDLRSYYTLTNAMVFTYTYKPHIGKTSETDASGKTTYYEYDIFGRLETIRDHDGNVIRHIDYHYENESD